MRGSSRLFLVTSLLLALVLPEAETEPVVYRLLRPDGSAVAYTEFAPEIGDYYWLAEEALWYRVVRVEEDVGWLEAETTTPPKALSPKDGRLWIIPFLLFLVIILRYDKKR